ncbi:hypothetical protein BCR34DRAFT_169059 [Clohesyomyces aquaticus]|uniref:Uncharacterized protein n=1 Tax=Clohesyomyces aquaticus TaxID=1231657 RepID=A0A1Y2A0H4_9PLEO|nr:hypothetical protein BCR34DRAFT_169059 [Clohesyomyces aquaticus]
MTSATDWIWSGEHQDYYYWIVKADGSLYYNWYKSANEPALRAKDATFQDIGLSRAVLVNKTHGNGTSPGSDIDIYYRYPHSSRQQPLTPTRRLTYTSEPDLPSTAPSFRVPYSLVRPESAPPARTTETYRPRKNCTWDIEIKRKDGRPENTNAVALIDSACQKGNWISHHLIKRMGIERSKLEPLYNGPTLDSGAGPVTADHEIELSFKRVNGNQYYDITCFVFPPNTKRMDMVIGLDFISEHDILSVNDGACLPLLENGTLSAGEQAEIAAAEARRRQEEAALEARRAAVPGQSLQQQSQTQRTQSQPQRQKS